MDESTDIWILDSGSSRHLVGSKDWLDDSEDASGTCVQPDGKPLNITKKGSVTLILTAMGQRRVVTITDVYYAHGLNHNLLSYGVLDQKGYTLARRGTQRVLTSADRKHVIFDIDLMKNVLTVHAKLRKNPSSERNVVMSAIGGEERSAQDLPVIAQQGSLFEFYKRLGHLHYDAIERLAKDPDSGISLTDRARPSCLTCAQGKQRRIVSPRKTREITHQLIESVE